MRNIAAALLALATVVAGVALYGARPGRPLPPSTVAVTPTAESRIGRTVQGVIRDANGSPVPFAAVTIGDALALTNQDGGFALPGGGATDRINVTANRFKPAAASLEPGQPVEVTLEASAEATLTARLAPGFTTLVLYDALSLAEVARSTGDGLTRVEGMRAGDYLAVARGRLLDPAAASVRLPMPQGGILELRSTTAAGTPIDDGIGATVSVRDVSGNPLGTTGSREVWLAIEAPDWPSTTATVGQTGSVDLTLPARATVRAFVWDRAASTVATSPARAGGTTLALTTSTATPVAIPDAGLIEARRDHIACTTPEIAALSADSHAANVDAVLGRELGQNPAVAPAYSLITSLVAAPGGRSLPAFTVVDLRDGTPLARLLPADESGEWATSWADIKGFLQHSIESAARRDRPVTAVVEERRDAAGYRHIDLTAIRNERGTTVPDGTWVALRVEDGQVLDPEGLPGTGGTLFQTRDGRLDDILYEPNRAGQPPGMVTIVTAHPACRASMSADSTQLAAAQLVEPYPRTLRFGTRFSTPRSDADCGPAEPFEAEVRVRFDRDGDGYAVEIPIAGGPTLRGTFDIGSGVLQAKGDIDATYWLIVASLSAGGTRLEGELTVTVKEQECNRIDHFPLLGVLSAPGDAVPSIRPSSLDDPHAPRS